MRSSVRKRPKPRPLAIEALENRELLSVDLSGGTLAIDGTARRDKIVVGIAGNKLRVAVNGQRYRYALADVQQLRIQGLRGNDRVVIRRNVPISAVVFGGPGNDVVLGGAGDDLLYGGVGRDVLRGRRGSDELHGDQHRDQLYGGPGHDSLYGGPGPDLIRGGKGGDNVHTDANDSVARSRDDIRRSGDSHRVEYRAWLTGTGPGSGKVEYQEKTRRGILRKEFEVHLWNANPNANYDISVGGVVVGSIRTDGSGRGKLEFTNRPHEPYQELFPANFPQVGPGTVVQADGLQGTLGTGYIGPAPGGGLSRPTGQKHKVEYKTWLSGVGNEWGKAEYEEEFEHGMLEKKFEVELWNASPSSSYDVLVDGVLVGTVNTNLFGYGKLELTNRPRKPHHQPLPSNFPQIGAGTVVEVDGIQGTLQWHYS